MPISSNSPLGAILVTVLFLKTSKSSEGLKALDYKVQTFYKTLVSVISKRWELV